MLANNSSQLPQGIVCQSRMCAKETSHKDVSYVGAITSGKKSMGESIWIQDGQEDIDSNLECLMHCRVGSQDVFVDDAPNLGSLSSWVRSNQSLVGNLHLKWLGCDAILLVFDTAEGVVLQKERV